MDWHSFDQKPESGKRIIALYSDGSGANLYFVHDAGLIDVDGEDCDSFSDDAGLWAYLPDGFELWCENRADDPVTFVLLHSKRGE